MGSEVAVLYCDTYEEEAVYQKLRRGLELLGGLERFVSPREKILLKPNLVRRAENDRAVVTHPAVAGAMARLLREAGCGQIWCGDSCGIGSAVKAMEGAGMDRVLKNYGVELKEFNEAVEVSFPEGKMAGEFLLARPVTEADALINLCKMKTHALERITGGVKNLYGCVSGLNKAKGHTKYSNADSFARMLVDLNRLVQPRLCVMDGIMAMEGNGPTSGDPIPMNLLLMSADPVALDTVFARLVHLDPRLVPTIVHGDAMGLGCGREEEIRLLGEEGPLSMDEVVRRWGNPDFHVDRSRRRSNMWSRVNSFLKCFQKKPYIVEKDCKRCGACVSSCPVEGKALRFQDGKEHPPVYDYRKCIRCFCCQEMCPYGAIRVK